MSARALSGFVHRFGQRVFDVCAWLLVIAAFLFAVAMIVGSIVLLVAVVWCGDFPLLFMLLGAVGICAALDWSMERVL